MIMNAPPLNDVLRNAIGPAPPPLSPMYDAVELYRLLLVVLYVVVGWMRVYLQTNC